MLLSMLITGLGLASRVADRFDLGLLAIQKVEGSSPLSRVAVAPTPCLLGDLTVGERAIVCPR